MTNGLLRSPYTHTQGKAERSHAEYLEGESLVEMVKKDLMASRISVDGCRDIIQYLRDQDAPTRHRLEGILAIKGQRASDAANRVARITADMKRYARWEKKR